ncbi:MAG: peptidoglycan DD-metalloendopeptidase family protein [Pseudanabaena sp.]|nr:peptidoglycan DD-metalloendopeptidase family protein [Pseudanabaena sp. M53BS1SP1A06MG]MCA6583932.1 peptidoglycan DD-metalloendopeptidase family protein [Pseudanabaena sp. M34BS1SP1A06MG]MCA6588142.1 peptidoglycan DD-metalloendopeptidase family protein [Pseudanabaena sp. M109S1SP1A06QC]MCA6590862.1 peptidoglycan DD-metalloendopeptidase family protein [Pseudanabaena sp. M38BS1SP1A06MG]MCA6602597.1 peptidoglycan DD-metalloendopeptidase family protein [Pseudanabaena sp. M57BS1SP1A06MG]MCA66053
MKKISSKDEELTTNVSLTLADKVSSLKVRRSLAAIGFALSAGTVGVLVSQQSANNNLKATPVTTSSRTLADVMAQNQERKYEMARTAIASGIWDNTQGVTVHEVREDETLWKLTQIYQVDAAAIAASNGISANTELQPRMKLMIPPVNGLVHKVKPGDTLEAISSYYNVPKNEIIKFTSLSSGDFLAIDQPLVIPGNVATLMQVKEGHVRRQLLAEKERLMQRLQELEGKKSTATLAVADSKDNLADSVISKQPKYIAYKVQNGDTIETIARRYGITQKSIIEANKLENPQWLELNQELKLPQNRNLPVIQTVAAANNEKPFKDVLLPVGDLSASNATANVNSAVAPIKVSQMRVTAGTPMVLPNNTGIIKLAAANRVSPWDGLMQLTGAAASLPNAPVTEQTPNFPSKSTSVQPSLPVAAEPALKIAVSLFPFAPEQLFGELGGSAKKNLATSTTALNVPARSISAPSIPAGIATEQLSANRSAPLEANPSQPVAEPKIQFSAKIAIALAIPQIPASLVSEQKVSLGNAPIEAISQPASEPTVKSAPVALMTAPTVPANRAIEQSTNSMYQPAGVVAQPASEPNLQIPAKLAANLAPKVPVSLSVEQATSNGKPSQVSLLPDSESRMTSLEVKRLETEVEKLNAKVRDAEIKEAARKAEEARRLESVKIAAANLNASPNPDRNFDASRSAIASPSDRSGVIPELPQLTARAYLPDVNDYGLSTGFIWPADGIFTSGFGWRWGRIHAGIDIAAPIGTPILAAASGVVEYANWNDGGYGNMIDIRHADGTITRYAHMNDLYVKEGQTVSQGQTIGSMGSTGFSTGPHLHFEIRPNGGSAIDPMTFLASAKR